MSVCAHDWFEEDGLRTCLRCGHSERAPEPPVTADHTPERLSAEERWMQDRRGESVHLWTPACPSLGCIEARRVPHAAYDALAAQLADVEARLAKVEALHKPVQWRGWRLWASRVGRDPRAFVDRWCRECSVSWPCPTYHALHPDPSAVTQSDPGR